MSTPVKKVPIHLQVSAFTAPVNSELPAVPPLSRAAPRRCEKSVVIFICARNGEMVQVMSEEHGDAIKRDKPLLDKVAQISVPRIYLPPPPSRRASTRFSLSRFRDNRVKSQSTSD